MKFISSAFLTVVLATVGGRPQSLNLDEQRSFLAVADDSEGFEELIKLPLKRVALSIAAVDDVAKQAAVDGKELKEHVEKGKQIIEEKMKEAADMGKMLKKFRGDGKDGIPGDIEQNIDDNIGHIETVGNDAIDTVASTIKAYEETKAVIEELEKQVDDAKETLTKQDKLAANLIERKRKNASLAEVDFFGFAKNIVKFGKKVVSSAKTAGTKLKEAAGKAKGFMKKLKDGAEVVVSAVKKGASYVKGVVDVLPLSDETKNMINGMADKVVSGTDSLHSTMSSALDKAEGVVNKAESAVDKVQENIDKVVIAAESNGIKLPEDPVEDHVAGIPHL